MSFENIFFLLSVLHGFHEVVPFPFMWLMIGVLN